MDIEDASESIWRAMCVEKDLAVSFFTIFARFEYAMKRQGFLQNTREAKPDWTGLARSLDRECEVGEVALLLASPPYLVAKRPCRQIVSDNRLSWDAPPETARTLAEVLLAVRTTRNNLFHGGKFPDGPVEEPLRDRSLIIDSSRALLACLELNCPSARGMKSDFWCFDAVE